MCQPTGRTPHASAVVLTAREIHSRSSVSLIPFGPQPAVAVTGDLETRGPTASRASHGERASASAHPFTVQVAPYRSRTRMIRQ